MTEMLCINSVYTIYLNLKFGVDDLSPLPLHQIREEAPTAPTVLAVYARDVAISDRAVLE